MDQSCWNMRKNDEERSGTEGVAVALSAAAVEVEEWVVAVAVAVAGVEDHPIPSGAGLAIEVAAVLGCAGDSCKAGCYRDS